LMQAQAKLKIAAMTEEAEEVAKKQKVELVNRAFVFLKPHAQLPAVRDWARKVLQDRGLVVESEGQINGPEIDKKRLIDQHYYAIASKATLLSPDKLPVSADKFQEKFGVAWDEVLKAGKAKNAMEACEEFGLTPDDLQVHWKACNERKDFVKLGGGFYCGHMDLKGNEVYVFNPFFMSMRAKFAAADASIYYYVVSWDPAILSWADFRAKLLGTTNPAEAPLGSLRRESLEKWQELGLPSAPDSSSNTVHASASPFESLAERINWLGGAISEDAFGSALLQRGMDEARVKEWFNDPRVTQENKTEQKSIYDSVEDLDVEDCLEKVLLLNGVN